MVFIATYHFYGSTQYEIWMQIINSQRVRQIPGKGHVGDTAIQQSVNNRKRGKQLL